MLIERFDYKAISRKQVNGRRLYTTPAGDAVPSVTTILDVTKPEEDRLALENWRKAIGHRKAQEITTEAANRGTRMHKYLENFVLEGWKMPTPGTNPYAKQANRMATIVSDRGMSNVSEVWGVEVPLFFPRIYAGTTDCVGIHDGDEAIIDFKQTNKPKTLERVRGYFKQLTAYAEAHNEVYGTNIRKGVIMMCSKDFEYQEFILELKEWDHYKSEWWKDVEKYYTMQTA